jgi:iron(III) transport system ATP-binding protein
MTASAAAVLNGASKGQGPAVRVSIRGVSKSFGLFQALRSISLDILDGEFVCFLGPSGCGKTTLLRAIAGLDLQSEGTIAIGGRDVSNLPPSARDFGIVFQSYALFPNLTVAANVGYGLVNKKRRRQEIAARVDELLDTVGLRDQASKYPVQLSGGQQQRVALARALATSPSLMLLDEPLSALDARVRLRLRGELKSLQRRLGVTTIMVTHDQEEAMGLADRIVVMNQGAIEQVGTPAEIYGRPKTAFVADFVGTMNFVPATATGPVSVRIGDLELRTAEGHGLSEGVAARVAVRPEDLRLCGSERSEENRFEAQVLALAFHGGFCRLTLSPSRAPAMHIAADVAANDMRDLKIEAGQLVAVALPPETIRVFPA